MDQKFSVFTNDFSLIVNICNSAKDQKKINTMSVETKKEEKETAGIRKKLVAKNSSFVRVRPNALLLSEVLFVEISLESVFNPTDKQPGGTETDEISKMDIGSCRGWHR